MSLYYHILQRSGSTLSKKSHDHNRNKSIFQEAIFNTKNYGNYTSHLSNGDTCRLHANHWWDWQMKQNKVLPYLFDMSFLIVALWCHMAWWHEDITWTNIDSSLKVLFESQLWINFTRSANPWIYPVSYVEILHFTTTFPKANLVNSCI